MEKIYKDLKSDKAKEFAHLLNDHFSKKNIKEGTVTKGVISKILGKNIFVFIEGCKSEGILDINEIKLVGEQETVKIGSEISVFIERLEDKNGDLVISREKALRFKNFENLQKAFDNQEEVEGKIISKIKGGFIVEVFSTMTFCPGSQLDTRPLKDISHLMREKQKFLVIKIDKFRGQGIVSRRAILEKRKNASKDEQLKKFKVGDIVTGVIKGIQSYGIFCDVDGYDTLTHVNHISWSRVGHPEEIFSQGQKQKLKIIDIDFENKRISTSIKELTEDPFEKKINNYEKNKIYVAEVRKTTEYGIFLALEDSLEGLCHTSQISWLKKESSQKKFIFGEKIKVKILDIDKEKRRISLSIKEVTDSPWEKLKKNIGIGGKVSAIIHNIADFGLFAKIKDYNLDLLIHYKDISFEESTQDLQKFKIDQEIEVKILEIDFSKEKIRAGIKQLFPDPYDYFKGKQKNEIITVTVKEILDNGVKVSPEGCSLNFLIKKNEIAINKEDARPNRFTKFDKIDCLIKELDLKKKKISLSIKELEKEKNREAVRLYGSVDSGKSLPFADLPDTLKDKKEK